MPVSNTDTKATNDSAPMTREERAAAKRLAKMKAKRARKEAHKRDKSFSRWLTARILFAFLDFMELMPPRRAIEFAAKVGGTLGPRSKRHKVVLDQLRQAFPEKSEEELADIALNMWRNVFRFGAEYLYLDKLLDPGPGQPAVVEIKGAEILERLREKQESCILFTAHTGSFELLPASTNRAGVKTSVLFRPPNNPYVAERLQAARSAVMEEGLVSSESSAARTLARALLRGESIGVLVDQKFAGGSLGTFFGRPVVTNPLVPKLARRFERNVYPMRCVRLPDGRYRVEIFDKLDLPRDAEGKVDIDGAAQMLNDVVESWVREYPDQWFWLHRRWEMFDEDGYPIR